MSVTVGLSDTRGKGLGWRVRENGFQNSKVLRPGASFVFVLVYFGGEWLSEFESVETSVADEDMRIWENGFQNSKVLRHGCSCPGLETGHCGENGFQNSKVLRWIMHPDANPG